MIIDRQKRDQVLNRLRFRLRRPLESGKVSKLTLCTHLNPMASDSLSSRPRRGNRLSATVYAPLWYGRGGCILHPVTQQPVGGKGGLGRRIC